MSEHLELLLRLEDTTVRRLWLLAKAVECLPLDRAIELARTAEAFLIGATPESRSTGLPAEESTALPSPMGHKGSLDPSPPSVHQQSASRGQKTLILSSDRRENLLDRLAAGATNVELAAEFGLSAQQVQGARIGSSRAIAKRREALRRPEQQATEGRLANATDKIYKYLQQKDEIVRYLQQQDDVVVRQADGLFLVNGRFRMSLADLVERANRMRRRQRKPEFEIDETQQRIPNRHHSLGDDGQLSGSTPEDKVSPLKRA
jgi:hypothetical protein